MKKITFSKKLLSLFVSFAMAFALLPAFSISAFADDITDITVSLPTTLRAGMNSTEVMSEFFDYITFTHQPSTEEVIVYSRGLLTRENNNMNILDDTSSFSPGEAVIIYLVFIVSDIQFSDSINVCFNGHNLQKVSANPSPYNDPPGSGIFTLWHDEGDYFCDCRFVYQLPYDTHSITKTVSPESAGSFTATVDGSEVTETAANDTVRLLPTANSGFGFESFTVIGGTGQIPVSPVDGGQPDEFEFTMPDEDVEIVCSFEPVESTEYSITEGDNITIDLSNLKDTVFTSNAPFELFAGVTIDENELVYDTDYTATSGSTIVTVKADTFKNMALGEHNLTIWSEDGHASTTFNVVDNAGAAGAAATDTGDSSTILLVLFAFGAICASAVAVFRVRRKN